MVSFKVPLKQLWSFWMIDVVQIALDSKIEAKLVLEDPDIEEMMLEFLTQIHVYGFFYFHIFSRSQLKISFQTSLTFNRAMNIQTLGQIFFIS